MAEDISGWPNPGTVYGRCANCGGALTTAHFCNALPFRSHPAPCEHNHEAIIAALGKQLADKDIELAQLRAALRAKEAQG